jgi:hypothetical protein
MAGRQCVTLDSVFLDLGSSIFVSQHDGTLVGSMLRQWCKKVTV